MIWVFQFMFMLVLSCLGGLNFYMLLNSLHAGSYLGAGISFGGIMLLMFVGVNISTKHVE